MNKRYIPKPKLELEDCPACGLAHATWWKTTPPPSCAERQERMKR